MLTNFKELENYVLSQNMKKRIALANAHDEPALSAVVNARRKGVVEGTLVGKKNEIIAMLHEMGESENDYEIVDFDGEELEAAKIAVQLVREGKADIPMKGILQTSNFARAILNKETGLIPTGGRRLVSQCGIFEYEGRFVMITDAAINIAPDVETQIGIVENALPVARALGIDCPKVAVLSAVENVTDKMPSTVSAKEIAERGGGLCHLRPAGAGWRYFHGVREAQGHPRSRGRSGGHPAGTVHRDRQRAVQGVHLHRGQDHGQHHLRCVLPGDHHQPRRHARQQVLLHPDGGAALPEGVTRGDHRQLSGVRAGAAPTAVGRAQSENVRGVHGVPQRKTGAFGVRQHSFCEKIAGFGRFDAGYALRLPLRGREGALRAGCGGSRTDGAGTAGRRGGHTASEAAEEEISKEGAANAVPFAAYILHVKGKLLYFWWCSLHTCE